MRTIALSVACVALFSSAVYAQGERRELGPHVHGAGTLNIAIEGNKVSMDFSAPANDIIGFEHQPSTPEQKQTLASAKEDLGQPLKLIEMPAAAGCKTESADIKFNAAEPAAPGQAQPAKAGEEEHQHADFDIDYVVTCADTGKLSTLSFPYFKRFAGANKLTVTVVSDKGQSQFDVTRESPSHDLK